MKRSGNAKLESLATTTAFPVRLHLRTDLHLARKTWHLLMGMIIAGVYYGSEMPRTTAVMIIGSILGFDLFMEALRLRVPSMNEKIMRYWGPVMRECEMNRLSGVPYYLASVLVAIAVFPAPVAVLSILYLACGDPIASLAGVLYGDRSIRFPGGKSLIGTAAGVVTCVLVSFVFLKTLPLASDTVLILSLIGGIAGGTVELLPLDIDDNFSIPIVSGFVLWLGFIIFTGV